MSLIDVVSCRKRAKCSLGHGTTGMTQCVHKKKVSGNKCQVPQYEGIIFLSPLTTKKQTASTVLGFFVLGCVLPGIFNNLREITKWNLHITCFLMSFA